MRINHVIPPTFFNSAIDLFTFSYDWYSVKKKEIDNLGREVTRYNHYTIYGSLQPQASSKTTSLSGNTISQNYNFYCKSLYRINIDDFIFYNNKWLQVIGLTELDEYGVRVCSLVVTELNTPRELTEPIEYLEGDASI